jgi:hypothetical protein
MLALSLFFTLLVTANAFQVPMRAIRLLRLRSTPEEQSITDLNLEEMFEVFDAADKKITSASVESSRKSTFTLFDAKKQIGSSSPFGFFDPAGYTTGITEDQFKLYQEAEIKHGRVSMLAVLGFVFGETFHRFFNGEINGPAIYQFQQADSIFPLFWLIMLTGIAMIEIQTIISAWQPWEDTLREPMGLAKLQSGHEPGNLKFDPLGLRPKDAKAYATIKTKELNNGRLAMLAIAGMVAQELVTDQPIF